jgi:Arc/MetJ-type ribon-helix-helix transcriptional regulator
MTTISVPIPKVLERFIKDMIEDGRAANKADLVRKALMKYREDEAIRSVLQAQQEGREGKNLTGDLDELAKKFIGWNS